MTVRMTVAQAKALGLIGGPAPVHTPVPRTSNEGRRPPRVKAAPGECRCTKCDVVLVGEKATIDHLSETGHLRYESIT